MNSYVLDPSIFEPPVLPDDKNTENIKKYKSDVLNFLDLIKKCENLIDKTSHTPVFIFRGTRNDDFNKEYVKKAQCYFPSHPLDSYVKKLNNFIIDDVCNHNMGDYFEGWFEFDDTPSFKFSVLNPALSDSTKFKERINMIGILNEIIYKRTNNLYFVHKKNNSIVSIETKNIRYRIKRKKNSEPSFLSKVELKSIDNINIGEKKFATVRDAVNKAQELFSPKYIIFGADVEKGLDTIDVSAGPPDKIFSYLETLVDFCICKSLGEQKFEDDFILKVLGCWCTFEKSEHMENEKVKADRLFDNGFGEKKVFDLHLKPSTYSMYNDIGTQRKTVRIHIDWDSANKKVVVGWIGKHLYLPKRKKDFPNY